MGFLTDFVHGVRRDLAERPIDVAALQEQAAAQPPPRSLGEAIRAAAAADGLALIAEVKRASPSAGPIAEVDPVAQARAYAEVAAVVSVLTEPSHFGGSLADLRAVRRAIEVPVLRKDFLVHPSQVLEARAAGADTVLLIVASLPGDELPLMLGACRDLDMEPLVETHSDDDLARALGTDAEVLGVNARDLETFEVDVGAALERLAAVPPGRITVMESGVSTRTDATAAADAGASAILVGEALMRAADPAAKARALIGREEHP